MALSNFHEFDQEYASAHGMLKAVFARAVSTRQKKPVNHVVHFACANGVWLAAARDLGAGQLLGIDKALSLEGPLCIPADCFYDIDLSSVKITLPAKADLAICVEYAHTVNASRGAELVAEICQTADAVLFGAALPFQSSLPGLNLQWPSYWARLFVKQGFYPDVMVRRDLWSDRTIHPVYRQNAVLYTRRAGRVRLPFKLEYLDAVHPAIFEQMQNRHESFARQLTKSTIRRLINKS